jgi:hypothetical protein
VAYEIGETLLETSVCPPLWILENLSSIRSSGVSFDDTCARPNLSLCSSQLTQARQWEGHVCETAEALPRLLTGAQ